MGEQTVTHETDERGVARLTLDRPEVHNAFDDALIERITAALEGLAADPRVRVVVVAARGRSFCAGADLGWMRRTAGYSERENRDEAERLARMLHRLGTLPKPTVACVQGAAYGGGVGLVAACDIAIASEKARFCFSEVRLGLIPAVISPFVAAAIGPRQTRRYFLTGEVLDVEQALELGLVHEVVPDEDLEDRATTLAGELARYGHQTLDAIKRLVTRVAWQPVDDELLADLARRIALQRATPEGREGVNAFLEKRDPVWPRG